MVKWVAARLPNEISGREYDKLLARLPIRRRCRVENYRTQKGAYGVLFAYGLLRLELERAKLARPVFAYLESGKPYFPEYPGLHFSLSHSKQFAACALADAPVGVDAETIRPVKESVWRRYLTDSELTWAGQDSGRLFRVWTLKESYFKLTGTGLLAPSKSVEFVFAAQGPLVNKEGIFARSLQRDNEAFALCAASSDLPVEPRFVEAEEILEMA